MKLRKEIKVGLIILGVLLVLLSGFYIYKGFFKKQEVNKQTIKHEIKEYGYYLNNNVTKLHEEKFLELEKLLKEENFDEDEYIKLISEIFVIDFYTLSVKYTNKDIASSQFVHEEIKENFIAKAEDTIYKYVESNLYNNRKQELPTVKEVTIKNIEETDVDGYENTKLVTLEIEYEKDLGYDNNLELILAKDNNKLSIINIEAK